MSNSDPKFAPIEKRIAEIEAKLPLEIRVAVSGTATRFPQGGLRLLLALTVAGAVAVDFLWLPIPTWAPILFLIPVSFLPGRVLGHIPGSQSIVWASERKAAITDRAMRAFRYLGMDNTQEGNALLLFICTRDRQFHLLADSRLEKAWPADDWQNHVNACAAAIKGADQNQALVSGISALLDAVEASASLHLKPRTTPRQPGDGELSNAVVVVDVI